VTNPFAQEHGMRSSLALLFVLFGFSFGCSGSTAAGGAGGRAATTGGASGGSGGAIGPGTGGWGSGGWAAGTGGSAGTPGLDASLVDAASGGVGDATVDSGGSPGPDGWPPATDGGDAGGGGAGGASTLDAGVDATASPVDVPVLDVALDAPAATDGEVASIDTTVSSVPDYLIIAADGLAASAARYRAFRQASGFNVDLAMVGDIVGAAHDAAAASTRMVGHVRARYQARDVNRPMYLLLLGDAQAVWPGDGTGVPAGTWQPASGSSVVSDNVFADMDGDDVPDLAVGRIPADSDAEADAVRTKVVAYEADREPGEWDRRINIFASTSGMGDLIDVAIESIVYDITEAVPYDYDVTMTYARQTSPYVYIPEQFSDQVYRRINEGSLLVAYVGHGSRDGFASLDWNGSSYPILDTDHLDKLAVVHKSPILLFIACSTGAFAGSESVSERILVRDKAPVAVFSSTEISDPYANALFTYEVSQVFTSLRAARVGDAFVEAKRRLLGNTDLVRLKIEALAAFLVGASARDSLKHSHLHMYTLFGDPAMAVHYVGHAQVQVDTLSASAGAELTITTTVPALGAGAEAQVTLESARKVIANATAAVPADGDGTRDAVIAKNYQAANDKVVAGATVPASGTSVTTKLTIPSTLATGQYHIKVFVHDSTQDYAGSALLTVN
jgi:hypothetical protein